MKLLRLAALPFLLSPLLLFLGCEVDSPSEVQRSVGANFTGFYTRTGESNSVQNIVNGNSGGSITSFDLRQGGDRLEAIDNHGIIFKGSIGDFGNGVATFDLVGRTTGGSEGTISGTLTASGDSGTNATGSTKGTMQGTWIEDSRYGTVFATASIPGVKPSSGGGGSGGSFQISSSSPTVAVFGSVTVSSSGGTGTTTWSTQNNRGTFSSTTGNSVTFTRNIDGPEVITGTDGIGRTDSLTIN